MSENHDIVVAPPAFTTEYAPPEQEIDSGSFAAILRRRWRTAFLITTLAAAASCSAIWAVMRPMYQVSATVHVAPIVPPILFSDLETDISRKYGVHMATQARVMVSPAVIQATLNRPDVRSLPSVRSAGEPAASIARRVAVDQERGTELLCMTMTGEQPADMAVIVNGLLESHIKLRDAKKRQADEQILRSLRREETELKARLLAKGVELKQLASDGGFSSGDEGGTAIDTWVAEIRRLSAQAERDRAVPAAKLKMINGDGEAERAIEHAPAGFKDYLLGDSEWQGLTEQLSMLEIAADDDEHLGRGPDHPERRGRPDRVNALRDALAIRESRLRELFVASERRRLEAQLFDAEITAEVYRGELEKVMRKRVQIARLMFVVEDVRHERQHLEDSLARVRQKMWNVEIEQNRMPRVTIDSRAIAPEAPNVDKRMKYTLAACLMSLFLGAVAALVRHRLDTSIRDPGEITRLLHMPLLGSIQRVPNTNGVSLIHDERMLEPLRGISTALLMSSRPGHAHSRLITSPNARSGKSSLAMNLSRSLASTGRRVLLVDADNSGQGVTRAFEMTGQPGLKEMLEGGCNPDTAVRSSDIPNLWLIPAGRRDPQFGDLLARQQAQESMCSLFATYDEVVVDSPPVLASSNTVILATLVDEVVLVLRAGKSTREQAQAARHYLATVGAKLVGVILNAVEPRDAPYPYYGYAYAESPEEETSST